MIVTATEWRIRRRLTMHAEQERWPVTPLLLGRIAKLAAPAGAEASIRRVLVWHAGRERWPVSRLLLGRMARLAAEAVVEGRPTDPDPSRTTAGRKVGRRKPPAKKLPAG